MKKYAAFSILIFAFVALATAAFAATPEPGTKCGVAVNRWICSYMADGPGNKPTGWYTPSQAIPAGKTIYKSCSMQCVQYHPFDYGVCMIQSPVFVERSAHANDVVLSSGARRAYCGTNAAHATEYWTFP